MFKNSLLGKIRTLTSISAPLAINALMTSSWPLYAAKCKALLSFLSEAFTTQPTCISHSTISRCPLCAA